MNHFNDTTDLASETAQGITVMDFYAAWCGPCKALAPQFEKWAAKFAKAKFVKVDVEQSQKLAASFSVDFLPTIVVLKDGKEVMRVVGMDGDTENKLSELIES